MRGHELGLCRAWDWTEEPKSGHGGNRGGSDWIWSLEIEATVGVVRHCLLNAGEGEGSNLIKCGSLQRLLDKKLEPHQADGATLEVVR